MISCVICAYNEEKNIGAVLKALSQQPLIEEIIVVNDGSSDNTASVAATYPRVRVLSHETNKGKSTAMVTGIRATQHEYLLFLDADLINITPEDVTKLCKPVLEGTADMSISLKKNSLLIYKILGIDFISGERFYKKSFFDNHIDHILKLTQFGVEVYTNRSIIQNNMRIAVVRLNTISHMRKADKIGAWKGFVAEIKMILDILKTVSIIEIIGQNYSMIRLKV